MNRDRQMGYSTHLFVDKLLKFFYNMLSLQFIETPTGVYYSLKEIRELLGFSNTSDLIQRYIDPVDCIKIDNSWWVNEKGFWLVFLAAKTPEAVATRNYLAEQILPMLYAQSRISCFPPVSR